MLFRSLFFADDSLIFCKVETNQAKKVVRILKMYEQRSSQMINMDKSSVIFSKNMDQEKQREIYKRLGNIQVLKQRKYLGLPIVITRTKEHVFGFIKENYQKTVNSWRNKMLSQEGKKILVKEITL